MASIPSERNRQLVSLENVSPSLRKATIAIEDRRFYEHGGVDWEGILRAAVRDIEAGKAVEGASTITQQLVRNLYPISSERTLERKVKEACLAIKLSRKWSKDKILATYMNAVYYGNHAYGVKAAARTYFNTSVRNLTRAAGGADRGDDAGAVCLRPVRPTGRGVRPSQRGLASHVRKRRHHAAPVPACGRGAARSARRARPLRHQACAAARPLLLQLRLRRARRPVRREHSAVGRSQGLHHHPAGPAEGRRAVDPRAAEPAHRPGGGRRLNRSAHRLDQGDDRGGPGQAAEPVQPGVAGAPPGRVDVQDVRARNGDPAGDRSVVDLLPVGAVSLPARSALAALGGVDLRPLVLGQPLDRERHAEVRQHGLRAAHARRRPGERRTNRAPARHHNRPAAVSVDGTRLDRGLAARDGVRVRHAGGGRLVLGADRHPQSRPPERP